MHSALLRGEILYTPTPENNLMGFLLLYSRGRLKFGRGGRGLKYPLYLRSAKTRVFKSKTCVAKCAFSKHSVGIRQRFGLRAKNGRAENPLVDNGVQENAETSDRKPFQRSRY